MRRLGSFVILLLLGASALMGQNMMPAYSIHPAWWGSSNDSASAMVWVDYSLESSAIQQAFLNKFVFGGFIDEALKDNANDALRSNNRLFYQSDLGAAYFSKRNESGRWYLQMRNQQITHLSFPPQLFQLTFYGNGSEKTDQGSFTHTTGFSSNWNRLDVGYNYRSVGNADWNVGANIGVLQVSNYWALDWPRGHIATDANGYSIDLDNELHLSLSDTATSGTFAMDGWGLAADLWVNVQTGGTNWTLSVDDAGYLWMNDQSLAVSLDTAFTYRGRDIQQVISGETSAVPSGETDSLLALAGASVSKESFAQSLPTRFSLVAQHQINNWILMGGASYRLEAFQLPLVFARVGYNNTSAAMQYGATLAYGGAGGFKLGLQWQKTFAEKWDLHLGLNHVNALILPNTFSGFSTFALIRYQL